MTCEDLGNPSKPGTNSATVLVNIVRNTAPFFDAIPYSTLIPATQGAGTSVFQVSARDNDVDVSCPEAMLECLRNKAKRILFVFQSLPSLLFNILFLLQAKKPIGIFDTFDNMNFHSDSEIKLNCLSFPFL